jgi:(1->4)-alpha-D-glucan 1-alpha-D-glucosylmutase
VYNRLTSLNEVGGDPAQFGVSLESFHRQNLERLGRWPHTMLATSTHDTKRSEDVRARINALSEIPLDWRSALTRWSRLNTAKKAKVDGEPAPDRNDEYLLYQTLVGAWPVSSAGPKEWNDFRERMAAYMQKAIKEAKVHTSWVNPNEAYDQAVTNFVRDILDPGGENEFVKDFVQFHSRIAYVGMLNSLSQTLLKIASPGVPDFYQGTELWNLSLVDPDNRHPVDFKKRKSLLEELKRAEAEDPIALVNDLLLHWQDGRLKLFVIYKALNFRRSRNELFQEGDYIPLYASGKVRKTVCAFARRKGKCWALGAVPRLITRIAAPDKPPRGGETWGESSLGFPPDAPRHWLNVLTGEQAEISPTGKGNSIALERLFGRFPVALLAGRN